MPVTIILLLTFLLWGFWPLRIFQNRLVDPFNKSLFPNLIPLGFALLFYAFRSNSERLSISSFIGLTPYLTAHGYAIALLGIEDQLLLTVLLVGVWIWKAVALFLLFT